MCAPQARLFVCYINLFSHLKLTIKNTGNTDGLKFTCEIYRKFGYSYMPTHDAECVGMFSEHIILT